MVRLKDGLEALIFRPAYCCLARLRALMPPHTPFMTLTATATKSDKAEELSSLEM